MRVSVVVPNYNKQKTLRACLSAVYGQTVRPAEVIVVDDASTDGSRRIAADFPCTLIEFAVNRGVSAARNAGAAAASGDVLFFVDSDIALAPEAVAAALRVLRRHPECGVVQGIYAANPLFVDSRLEVYRTLFEHYWRRRSAGADSTTLFALTAVPRQVFDEVGGFDESLRDGEDTEFGTRLPAKYLVWTSPDVVGAHDDVDRLWPYLTEHLRRARMFGRLIVHGFRPRATAGTPSRGRTDLATAAAMLSCTLALSASALAAVAASALAPVAPWLLLVAGCFLVIFVLADRELLWFVLRERGPWFTLYFAAMHILMHSTQLAGMAIGGLGELGARARVRG